MEFAPAAKVGAPCIDSDEDEDGGGEVERE